MKIYLDVDNVVLNSIKASVSILNDIHKTNVDYHDIHEWNYSDKFPFLTQDDILESFGSEEFFHRVEINPDCEMFIMTQLSKKNPVTFFTKGTKESIMRKADFIETQMPFFADKCGFIGIPIEDSKGKIDLSDGCLIDDNQDNLFESNAKLKILFMQDNQMGDWNDKWDGLYCNGFRELGILMHDWIV